MFYLSGKDGEAQIENKVDLSRISALLQYKEHCLVIPVIKFLNLPLKPLPDSLVLELQHPSLYVVSIIRILAQVLPIG